MFLKAHNPCRISGFSEHPAQVAGLVCFVKKNLSWTNKIAFLLIKWPHTNYLSSFSEIPRGHGPASCPSQRLRQGRDGHCGTGAYDWCPWWDLDVLWAGRLSTTFARWRTSLALPMRKCHVSDLQCGAPAFPVWLTTKGKGQKGTEEEGKQLSGFEEHEWCLPERRCTDSTLGHIPCMMISAHFPFCSKCQLWTGLPACHESTHANSRCKRDFELLFFNPYMICEKKKHISNQFNTCNKDSLHAHTFTHDHYVHLCTDTGTINCKYTPSLLMYYRSINSIQEKDILS